MLDFHRREKNTIWSCLLGFERTMYLTSAQVFSFYSIKDTSFSEELSSWHSILKVWRQGDGFNAGKVGIPDVYINLMHCKL